MASGTSTLDTAAVLAAARRARCSADAAELEVFEQAVLWAGLHEVSDVDDAATWGDSPVPLAGPGAPLVGSFCVSEFSACLGLSDFSGRSLLAHAVEIAHRLPCLWGQVRSGRVRVWKARRIAERTLILSAEAAAYVDRHLAPYAGRISIAAVERLVDEAIARHMPEVATQIAARAADARHVSVHHDQVSFAGTSRIEGELDLADALDLDAALQAGARQLADLGSELHLDARRALALGQLARGEQALTYTPQEDQTPRRTRRARQVVLYAHLSEQALRTRTGIPDRLREQITLRDQTCVFPYCTRPPRACDLDHIEPFEAGGGTTSENLAPLCRRHHRLKTHAGWTYTPIEPGTYLWRSPHGYTFTTQQGETRDLTPRPLDPPGG